MQALNRHDFDPGCPYFQERNSFQERNKGAHEIKLFRIYRFFENSQPFTADSFGDRRYIEATEQRHCSQECSCRLLDRRREEDVFSFVAYIDERALRVQIHSATLRLWLLSALRPQTDEDMVDENDTFCGFQLLKHRRSLMHSMKSLPAHHQNEAFVAEIGLLVSGLLSDPELFYGFGYENLYERGYLAYEDWRTFQEILLHHDLDLLEQSVDALDMLEAVEIGEQTSFDNIHSEKVPMHLQASQPFEASPTIGFPPSPPFEASPTIRVPPLPPFEGSPMLRFPSFPFEDSPMIGVPSFPFEDSPARVNDYWISSPVDPTHRTASIKSQLTTFSNLRQRATLEEELGCPENALIAAAEAGNLPEVKRILQLAKELGDEASDGPGLLIDLDAVRVEPGEYEVLSTGFRRLVRCNREMTALMAATAHRHYVVAKFLLEKGADVNLVTKDGNALSIADHNYQGFWKYDAWQIGQLLLKNGADISVALLKLRDLGTEPRVLSKWFRSQASHQYESAQYDESLRRRARVRRMLRQLHGEFLEEHRTIFDATLRHTPSNSPSLHWTANIELHWQNAWRTGVRVLRELCKGIPPKTLNDTIMFLGVAKAMSRMIRMQDPDNQEDFLRDLGRWQLVFSSEDGSLEDFQYAVNAIWKTQLSTCTSLPMPDTETMASLQELVRQFVSRANSLLGLRDNVHGGFLATQQRWRSNVQSYHSKYPNNDGTFHGTHFPVQEDEVPVVTPYFDPPMQDCTSGSQHGGITDSPQSTKLSEEDSSAKRQVLMAFLIAGAIFATVVSFFLIILRFARYPTLPPPPFPYTNRAQLYQPIAKHALDHILWATAIHFNVSKESFAEVRSDALVAIQHGLISTYSGLREFLIQQGTFMSGISAPQLQFILDAWHSTFLAQETHTLLSLYLGFTKYKSIVPHQRLQSCEFQDSTAGINGRSKIIMSRETALTASFPTPSSHTPPSAFNDSSQSSRLPTSNRAKPSQTFCEECREDHGTVSNYNRHRKEMHDKIRYPCAVGCGKTFSRNDYRINYHEPKCQGPRRPYSARRKDSSKHDDVGSLDEGGYVTERVSCFQDGRVVQRAASGTHQSGHAR